MVQLKATVSFLKGKPYLCRVESTLLMLMEALTPHRGRGAVDGPAGRLLCATIILYKLPQCWLGEKPMTTLQTEANCKIFYTFRGNKQKHLSSSIPMQTFPHSPASQQTHIWVPQAGNAGEFQWHQSLLQPRVAQP